MMPVAALLTLMAVGQFDPYVRSRVTAGDPSTQALYWTVPLVTWNLNRDGNPATPGETEFQAVRASFQSWQDIFTSCGNLSLREGPLVDSREVGYLRGKTNHNLVLFRTQNCSGLVQSTDPCWKEETCANQHDCWDDDDGTLAITLTTYDKRSGIIYDSDISFNASRYFFTAVDGPPCTAQGQGNCVATDVQNTATHEIGHFIGLDHTRVTGSTMFPSAPPGEVSKRDIDPGSRDFVCDVYPKGRPSQSDFHPAMDTLVGGPLGDKGCSATGATATSMGPALLAWAWLRRRRRGAAEGRS
ncbi:myxosortase-dependent metalloprotease, MXAN_2677/MXAN_2678 family [Myxococcus sp. AB025B]|uniref:myxosortase-dependent metalloprotease, MXAN_2677/MXAN_2678 family n=1 Tax=Myxococcus sp. AB025B TaxID=2562794 RepID=UPI0011419A2C|nr:myxosortase-dependent metalloprotease, MXAN_2677/MXAN_2678 family [Myxococcus sp. AB025B]